MPIIEKKTVRFCTDVIPGVDSIEYVDALFKDVWQPFDESWEVYRVDLYKNGVDVWCELSEDVLDAAWELARQHQAKAHENDE